MFKTERMTMSSLLYLLWWKMTYLYCYVIVDMVDDVIEEV